jgi:hypothetical protein
MRSRRSHLDVGAAPRRGSCPARPAWCRPQCSRWVATTREAAAFVRPARTHRGWPPARCSLDTSHAPASLPCRAAARFVRIVAAVRPIQRLRAEAPHLQARVHHSCRQILPHSRRDLVRRHAHHIWHGRGRAGATRARRTCSPARSSWSSCSGNPYSQRSSVLGALGGCTRAMTWQISGVDCHHLNFHETRESLSCLSLHIHKELRILA